MTGAAHVNSRCKTSMFPGKFAPFALIVYMSQGHTI